MDEDFRTFGIDDPEVRALQRSMPQELFALGEHLLGRWQQAGLPLRPLRRGFAFQTPYRDGLTTVAWLYAPDRRHKLPRVEVGFNLMRRRGVPDEYLAALRDNLTRVPGYIGDDDASLVAIPLTDELTPEDVERIAAELVQFGRSLA